MDPLNRPCSLLDASDFFCVLSRGLKYLTRGFSDSDDGSVSVTELGNKTRRTRTVHHLVLVCGTSATLGPASAEQGLFVPEVAVCRPHRAYVTGLSVCRHGSLEV